MSNYRIKTTTNKGKKKKKRTKWLCVVKHFKGSLKNKIMREAKKKQTNKKKKKTQFQEKHFLRIILKCMQYLAKLDKLPAGLSHSGRGGANLGSGGGGPRCGGGTGRGG